MSTTVTQVISGAGVATTPSLHLRLHTSPAAHAREALQEMVEIHPGRNMSSELPLYLGHLRTLLPEAERARLDEWQETFPREFFTDLSDEAERDDASSAFVMLLTSPIEQALAQELPEEQLEGLCLAEELIYAFMEHTVPGGVTVADFVEREKEQLRDLKSAAIKIHAATRETGKALRHIDREKERSAEQIAARLREVECLLDELNTLKEATAASLIDEKTSLDTKIQEALRRHQELTDHFRQVTERLGERERSMAAVAAFAMSFEERV